MSKRLRDDVTHAPKPLDGQTGGEATTTHTDTIGR
jgi:hypothetical protein